MASWLEFNKSGDVIEIIVRDGSGRKLDSFKFNGRNKVAFAKTLKILKEVYNFAPEISKEADEVKEQREKINWYD